MDINLNFFLFGLKKLGFDSVMATTQLTASSVSARNLLPSFEGLKSSNVRVSSFAPLRQGGLSRRSFRGLVVKAATVGTVVTPKVLYPSSIICNIDYFYEYCC